MRVRSYKYESGLNAFCYNTNASANKRGYSFELTLDEISNLSQQVCTYCGKEPEQFLSSFPNFIYNGIDRVDNTKGYEIENCVTCCKLCNRMKDTLSLDEFKNHIAKVVLYQKELKSCQNL